MVRRALAAAAILSAILFAAIANASDSTSVDDYGAVCFHPNAEAA